MRIFVAYGYHTRDAWIGDLVFELIRAFGMIPVDGKEIYGQSLSDGVKNLIGTCDALIGFTTKRTETTGESGGTHRWVIEELLTAEQKGVAFVEVREIGVTQGGMLGGRQHIDYDETRRDRCLVEIAKALKHWREALPVRLKLLPQEITDQIRAHMRKPGFRCSYRLLNGSAESPPIETNVVPITGGLYVRVADLKDRTLVSVTVEAGGKIWISDYEGVDAAAINLKE